MPGDAMKGVYEVKRPQSALPLVFDSPHSGREYPADFGHACPADALYGAEDNLLDALYADAPTHGVTLLCALFPRTYIDANRGLDDIDPALLAEAWPEKITPTERASSGNGLVRRIVRPGIPIYDRTLSNAEIQRRIDGFYAPYHARLAALLDEAHYNFGQVWHVNCHSMPARASMSGQPDFVVGDRDGTSCERAFTHAVRDMLKAMGYRVALNNPFKGAEILKRHGRPAGGRHSLQLEVSKALYWNESAQKKTANFAALQRDLSRLAAQIAAFTASQTGSMAAD
jgi:N-formylglutamate deformylase